MRHATTAIAEGLAEALVSQYDALSRRRASARKGQVKGVHRARVASRRLREILAVAEATNTDGHPARIRRAIRKLTRALGPVREMDVALIELDRRARRHGWPDHVALLIRRTLERAREHRAELMDERIDRHPWQRCRHDIRQLADHIRSRDDRSWRAAVSARVIGRARAVLEASAKAGTIYVPERLHALRIAIKKLRYAVELLPPTPEIARADVPGLLKRAQDRFGTLHDVQILLAEASAIDAVPRRPAERAALTGAIEDLERDCREIHAQALALVPTVDDGARLVRRELSVRRQGRLPMAKAPLDKDVIDPKSAVRNQSLSQT